MAFSNAESSARAKHAQATCSSNGHEIDVLIDAGDRLIPVKAKSGSTIAATACGTINWWTSLSENPNRGGVIVHGGDRSFDFKGVRALPWFING